MALYLDDFQEMHRVANYGLWFALPFSQLAPDLFSLGFSLLIHQKRAVDLGIKARKNSGYSVSYVRKHLYQNKGVRFGE